MTLSCKQTGATLDASFFVQGAAIERVGRPARPEVLEEIARVTRGQVIEPARLEQVIQSLAALPEPPPAVRRLQLWSHPATIGRDGRLAGCVLGGAEGGRIDLST